MSRTNSMPKPRSNAAGRVAVEQNAGRQGIGDDAQIRPLARGPQIADGGAATQPLPRGHLEIADSLLSGAVEIVVARDADLLAGGDEGLAQLMRLALIGDRQGPVAAM